MNRRQFTTSGSRIQLDVEDLENSEMNQAFEDFYADYINSHSFTWQVILDNKDIFFNSIESKSIPFTAPAGTRCKAEYHDGFFNNFTIAWQTELGNGNYKNAILIWEKAIEITKLWETTSGHRIHKGTPYYFNAVSCLENDEIEVGFALMYEAYFEDLQKNGGNPNFDSPAKSFIEFKTDTPAGFYQSKLDEIKDFLINEYITPASINFIQFESNFLQNIYIPILVKYQFLLNLFRIWKAKKRFDDAQRENELLGLMYIEIIFSLSRLIEPIYEATSHTHPTSNKDVYKNLCTNTPNIFDVITRGNFGNTGFIGEMQNILINKSVTLSRTSHSLTDEERDILLSYGFRNLAAHQLFQDRFINENIDDILKSIFRTLFMTF